MQVTLYGLTTCESCRKARAALREAGHPVIFRDIRADPLSPEDIGHLLGALGTDLVNRRSATWRGLDPAARAAPPGELLAAHPALMKRPVIEVDGRLWLGWDSVTQAALA